MLLYQKLVARTFFKKQNLLQRPNQNLKKGGFRDVFELQFCEETELLQLGHLDLATLEAAGARLTFTYDVQKGCGLVLQLLDDINGLLRRRVQNDNLRVQEEKPQVVFEVCI